MSSDFWDCCEGFGSERVKCVWCSLVCVLCFLLWSLALDSCNDKLSLKDTSLLWPEQCSQRPSPLYMENGDWVLRRQGLNLSCSALLEPAKPCVVEPISACGGRWALVFLLPSSTLRSQFLGSSLICGSHPLMLWVLPHVSLVPHVMVAWISQRGGPCVFPGDSHRWKEAFMSLRSALS